MVSVPRLTARNSAEQVECRDELITDILSRVSTRVVVRMSVVSKRWRSLIVDPNFAHTHYRNCHQESVFCLVDRIHGGSMPERYEFCSCNSETGKLSIVPLFFWEGLDRSCRDEYFEVFTPSNGLLCFYPRLSVNSEVWVYNPARKFSKKLLTPFKLYLDFMYFGEICYVQNTLKLVMAGFSPFEKRPYTLVFDSHSNSWHEGSPLLRSISCYNNNPLLNNNLLRAQFYLNGVIYFVAKVGSIDAQELEGIRDGEVLFRDDNDLLYMIIGYDVNQDHWSFSIFIPASVGFVYCLLEWEGNLLVCASNSTHEENLLELSSSSNHDHNQRIKYNRNGGDGHFVFWILDTKHKLWIRERELDLSHHLYTSWKVSASGGVVWFAFRHNVVTVYHMKNRQYSTYPLDNDFSLLQRKITPFISFEPTLLSF